MIDGRGWGGRILIAEPVLEEVSRHAYIAQVDFDHVVHLLPGTPEDRLHLIGNVFVRAFGELVSEGKAKISHWRSYIAQFRGASQYEWANIFSVLEANYSIEKLPARSLEEASLEKSVREFLLSQAVARADRGPVTPFAQDKARRDAQLYAALVHYVATLRRMDPGATCLLVSSARRLAVTEEKFHGSGEAQLVVSIGALLHLLSLLPEVSLGLSAMKAFLFDEYRHNFSSDLERTLMRMVSASSERSIKFAKRGLLMRSVRDHVLKDATEKGLYGSEARLMKNFERQGFTPKNQASTMELLSAALDKAGVQRRSELEKAALEAKIRELEAKLERKNR